MNTFSHPLWLVGFRPFFALAALAGAVLPMVWVLVFSGHMPAPGRLSPVQWHAHEMFYGFGGALLGGFLLTATKNWVAIRGWHGGWLVFLAGAWCLERLTLAFGGNWPQPLYVVSASLYFPALVAMVLHTLIRYHSQDSLRDNWLFILALPLFLPAKFLLLSEDQFPAGWGMTLGLFRLVFLIMLERTTTQFMKAVLNADILRDARLDYAIKCLALALVFSPFLPEGWATWLSLLLAGLLLFRFAFWKPGLAFSRLDIGIMHLGYLGLALQLVAAFVDGFFHPAWSGTVTVHLFTLAVMGLIAPALVVRISKGHTGRRVVFEFADKLPLWVMMLALAPRLILPQWFPDAYLPWLGLAAGCWFVAFGVLAWRVIPILLAPRADGREH